MTTNHRQKSRFSACALSAGNSIRRVDEEEERQGWVINSPFRMLLLLFLPTDALLTSEQVDGTKTSREGPGRRRRRRYATGAPDRQVNFLPIALITTMDGHQLLLPLSPLSHVPWQRDILLHPKNSFYRHTWWCLVCGKISVVL